MHQTPHLTILPLLRVHPLFFSLLTPHLPVVSLNDHSLTSYPSSSRLSSVSAVFPLVHSSCIIFLCCLDGEIWWSIQKSKYEYQGSLSWVTKYLPSWLRNQLRLFASAQDCLEDILVNFCKNINHYSPSYLPPQLGSLSSLMIIIILLCLQASGFHTILIIFSSVWIPRLFVLCSERFHLEQKNQW